MKAVVIYESMYGNTRAVAEAVAEGLRESLETTVLLAADLRAQPAPVAAGDLLVVGAPTHSWSMPRMSTRRGAVDAVTKQVTRGNLALQSEPRALEPGVREWLARRPQLPARWIAVFDTRMHAPLGLSGSAGRAIMRRLKRSCRQADVTAVKAFYVDRRNVLDPGELDRAREWGAHLARAAHPAPTAAQPAGSASTDQQVRDVRP